MPIEFLTADQKSSYGKFAGSPTEVELSRYFHLDQRDRSFIYQRRGAQNQLGFALQLTSVRFIGAFPMDLDQTPTKVQETISRQLGIEDTSSLQDYAKRENTRREHRALIIKQYGYQDFGDPLWRFRLNRVLYARSWMSDERPSLMFHFATDWLIQHKVLLPGISTLVRLISEIRERTNLQLWKKLSSLPSNAQKERLDTLLEKPDGQRQSRLDSLRKGPVTISAPAFNKALDRYLELIKLEIHDLDLSHIPPVRLNNLARHAGLISVSKISRMPSTKRTAILIAFAKAYQTIALDEALDVFDMLVGDIAGQAKKIGQKKRLRTLKDLDKSAITLAKACSILLDDQCDLDDLLEKIFLQVPKDNLSASIKMVYDLARPAGENYEKEKMEQYGRVRRFLPNLFGKIKFKAAPAGKTTLQAFEYLASLGKSRKQILEKAPLEIINGPWEKLVFDQEGRVTRKGFTLCLLDKMQDSLRRRDIYVEDSDRWGDPRAKLLKGKKWASNRIQICRSLGQPVKADKAISNLQKQLDETYKQVSKNFENNFSVRVDKSGKRPTLTITNLDKLEDSPTLSELASKVSRLLPKVDLTELLLEIHAHTLFANEFTHVSESKARADDIHVSICAVLVAEACNIGLEPLIKHQIPALTRHRLNWVKQNYIRAETLTKANARLVDFQSKIVLAQKWGGGEVASADGMRFVTPIRTINAGPNRKYFGSNRGVTWYNFVSDQYSGFHGIVIPGTLRDSIFVLEGLLEQETSLNPTEIMTDTAGASDLVFGLFWLLGYQFSPRLADAGEAVFWRSDNGEDYGIFNEIARTKVNLKLVEQQWDDMLRIAGSLKMGTVHASELIKTLLKSERPSSLTQAIIEAGKINKTIYLLNYVDDEDYRRRILIQLNRGEGRHSLARAICHGQRGELENDIERARRINSVL